MANAYHAFADFIQSTCVESPFKIILWGLFLGCSLTFVIQLTLLRRYSQITSQQRTIWIFLLILIWGVVIATISSVIVSGNFINSATTRYIQSAAIFPAWFGWLWLFDIGLSVMNNRQLIAVLPIVFNIGALALYIFLFVQNPITTITPYYPNYVNCLDQHAAQYGLKNGITGYWTARPLTLFSHESLVGFPVVANLLPFAWMTKEHFFSNQLVNFALIDTKNPDTFREDTVVNTYGPPAATFECEQYKVLVYNRLSDQVFQTMFDGYIESLVRSGDEFSMHAANYPLKRAKSPIAHGQRKSLILLDY
jgi:hypothetical protein